ncbi:MAG: hypothetical protein JRG90_12205 [Deltaproteobacteria bacterium]|nr:hypothetical protein [Deltaproteobacteria bacterium]MBW2667955.1 hypothetical protein [Deltaproteobacteria bacterium]
MQRCNHLLRQRACVRVSAIGAIFAFLHLAGAAEAEPPAHQEQLHFAHPLVVESPSPDTKIRLHYFFDNDAGEDKDQVHTLHLEAEFAFARWVSLEVDTPYTFISPEEGGSRHNVGDVEVALKFACFAFAESGLLLGAGIEFGIPTGNDDKGIGSSHTAVVEPFLDAGFKVRDLETVAFLAFGVPFNTKGGDEAHEADWEVEWELAFLYHVMPWLEATVEFEGEHVVGGEEDGVTVFNMTPGIKVTPFEQHAFKIGAGVSFPLTHDNEYNVRGVFSLFYHF